MIDRFQPLNERFGKETPRGPVGQEGGALEVFLVSRVGSQGGETWLEGVGALVVGQLVKEVGRCHAVEFQMKVLH